MPPGRYTLFSIPEPAGGTLIVSRQTGQNGTAYDPAHDLGRTPLTAETLPEEVELFTIDVADTDAGGKLQLKWGRTALTAPFTVLPAE